MAIASTSRAGGDAVSSRVGSPRRSFAALPFRVLAAAGLALALLLPAGALAEPPGDAFRYVQDADSRLKAAIDPEGETATYGWDIGGNLLSIQRTTSDELAILQLSPESGEAGDTIEIQGTGFSPTPEENTVKFNGTAAAVESATPWSLSVEVPAETTSGTVTVETPEEGPVTSTQTFTIASSSKPSITSLEPTIAAAGDEVTISGANFDAAQSGNVIMLNGSLPQVTSASPSSVKFKVPTARLGGPIVISTPEGSSSGPDLFVAPSGTAKSEVSITARISLDESKSISIATSGTVGLLHLEGTAGQRVSLTSSESAFDGMVTLFSPSGSSIGSASVSKSSVKLLGPVTLPATGTYTIRVDPSSTQTGSVKLSAYVVEDVTGTVEPTTEGVTESVSITTPGQVALYSVAVEAGEAVSVKKHNSTIGGACLNWLDSEGKIVGSTSCGSFTYWGQQVFANAGTYTLRLKPENSTKTGSIDLVFWDSTNVTGSSLTPSTEGDSGAFSIQAPGQHNLITFEGTKDQRISVLPSEASFSGSFKVLRPTGATVTGSTGNLSTLHGPFTLPEDGTYTIDLEGASEQTGSVKLSAYVVEDVTGTVEPTTEGVTESVSITTPGQVALYSVAVEAGEAVSVKKHNSTIGGACLNWLDSEGKIVGSTSCGSFTYWGQQVFANAGTYTLRLKPENSTKTGSIDLVFWDSTNITGSSLTPSTEGDSDTFSIQAPGQHNLITFEGTKDQRISVLPSEASFSGSFKVLRPTGATVTGSTGNLSTLHGPFTLPEDGTYTIDLEGASEQTGSVKLTAYIDPLASWGSPDSAHLLFISLSTEGPGSGEPIQIYSDAGEPARGGIAPRENSVALAGKSGTRMSGLRSSKSGKRQFSGPVDPSRSKQEKRTQRGLKPYADNQIRLPRHDKTPRQADSQTGTTPEPFADLRAWEPKRKGWLPPMDRDERGWIIGRADTPWLDIAQLHAPASTTALAGQALHVNGLPLAGVSVAVDGSDVGTTTDDTGRFLLSGLPAGHQRLLVDGESVPGGKRYGTFEIGVDLAPDKTTELDYTLWLTPLEEAGDLKVASPTKREASLKTPHIPGLEVRIPAGTVIRDAEGEVVTDLNITAIPLDRPQFPLPPFVSVPIYFTVQPGRATLSKGAQFVYPNWADLAPGQRVDFWNYDPADRGWYVYGRGSVTPDGQQVAPDPGVQVWEFTGAMAISAPTPPAEAPIHGASAAGGDPVDLRSGLFTYSRTDLTVPDTMPISIERTYRPKDSNSYDFGIGTTSIYDLRLWSNENYKNADLVLPDGATIHYVRTSPGVGYEDAIYETTNQPSAYAGSTITWNKASGNWDMSLRDGTTLSFDQFTRAPLVGIRDQHGNKLTIKRSGDNITEIVSPNGRWAKFTYDGSNRITKVVDNGGRELKYTYTSNRLTKVEAPEGRTTEYEYDGSGRMKAVINARGNKYLQNEYDANGRTKKQVMGDGGIFEFAYDLSEEGDVEATTITDPRGNERKVEFDAEGFPVKETRGLGTEEAQTTIFERQAEAGLILSTTDPLGRKTAFEYDNTGNVTEVTRLADTEDAVTTKLAYEPGTTNVTKITDPLGHVTEFEYGPKGQLLKQIDALENETTFKYNGDGQPSSITNPEGEETTFGYVHGDLAAITDPLGRTTSQFTDALGRVRAITSAGGLRTRLSYNDADELTAITTPSGAKTTIAYDKDGDVTSIVDPRENETTAGYDSMDRPATETNPLEDTAEWSHDKAGNLVEAVSRNGEVSKFGYDALGRLAKARFGVEGESAESTIEYEYDAGNRLIGVEDSASGEYVLSYDDLDRLTAISGPNGAVGYLYDDADRRAFMLVPGQEAVAYEHDDADRLIGLARGGDSVALAYDGASRMTGLTLPNGVEQLYGYDKAGQATSITYKDGESTLGDLHYAYDADGRTKATWGSFARMAVPQGLAAGTYNAANQLTERGEEEFSYDKEGNLVDDGSSEYAWDARGQLTGISGAANAAFAYDAFGRRTSKTLDETTTQMLHDGANVVQESSGEESTATTLAGMQPDQLFSRAAGEGTDSYLTDLLGSTIALANDSGEVETAYTYEPFGAASSEGAESDNPYQFTGRENDGTGLQFNRARYYSPTAARFISPDPAGFGGSGPNLYNYVGGAPLDFTDPTGEIGISVGGWGRGVEEALRQAIGKADSAPGKAPGFVNEHRKEALGIAAFIACVRFGGTSCVLAGAGAGGSALADNYEKHGCLSGGFWRDQAVSTVMSLISATPGIFAAGVRAAEQISSNIGRMAFRGKLAGLAGGTPTIVTPRAQARFSEDTGGSKATSSC